MMLLGTFCDQDVSGWLMSEKLDGCRAYWDGKYLRTRGGFEIRAPERIMARLPVGVALDGELWGGRGTFQRCRVAVQHRRPEHPDWNGIDFHVFDAPSSEPLEIRLWEARRIARECGLPFVEQRRIASAEEAFGEVDRIEAEGGEGVVLRRPGSKYQDRRSDDWLKLKPENCPTRA
jgi:DNA ligase-1